MKTMWGTLKISMRNKWTSFFSYRSVLRTFLHFSGIVNTQLVIQGLTGLDDLGVCRALLESQSWDLEAVAREHLGISG